MKRFFPSLVCALVAVCLAGCLQIEKTVKLKADGSGTVEETMVMSKAMVEQMKQMGKQFAAGFGAEAKPKAEEKEFSLLDENKLKQEAAQMGEGVTFVSAKKISTESGEGYTATYAFTDINKLKLDQNPASAAPKMGPASGQPEKKEIIGFQFAKGNPATLTIKMPAPDFKKKDAAAKKEKPDAAATQMAMQFFKDMKISIGVEVAGKIVETNAGNREGSRVTLMEMDFNKLLADPKKFAEFTENEPESLEEAKKILKTVPGVKMETSPLVTIKFQ